MNDEVVVNLECRRYASFFIGTALFSFASFITMTVLLSIWLDAKYFSPLVIFIITLFLSSTVIKGLLWKLFGRRVLTFSSKYFIMEEIAGRSSVYKVIRMEAVERINLGPIEGNSWWLRFKSFWTRNYDNSFQCHNENGLWRIAISVDEPMSNHLMHALSQIGLRTKMRIHTQ